MTDRRDVTPRAEDGDAVIYCSWRDAVFLWVRYLTPQRLAASAPSGDLARARDALERARAQTSLRAPAFARDGEGQTGAHGDTDSSLLARQPPLLVRMARGDAVMLAEYLTNAIALPALPGELRDYELESPYLVPTHMVDEAQAIGLDWQRQLYVEPNA
jgi:hypothetical protein